MESPVAYIFEALENSDVPDKDKLKEELLYYLRCIRFYFSDVINENLYYSETPKEKQSFGMFKMYDEKRREDHDQCMFACSGLNVICSYLNIDRICNFDVQDRAMVAAFCGYLMCSMYFGNIKNNESVNRWIYSFPLLKGD